MADFYLTRILKADIHPSASISLGANIDKASPRGVHVGAESYIASGVLVLAINYVYGTTRRYLYWRALLLLVQTQLLCVELRLGMK